MRKFVLTLCACALLSSCVFSLNPNGGKRVVCRGEVILKQMDTELNLPDFDRIAVNGQADLKYVQDEGFGVQVEANSEVFEHLNFHVDEGTLILETKDKVQIKAEKFDIYVASPILRSVEVNGAADLSVIAISQAEDLDITVNGAGDCELQNIKLPDLSFTINGAADLDISGIDVEKLFVRINGAGDATISGKADYASFSVSGAGDIDARELDCDDIDKSKSGAASIRTR